MSTRTPRPLALAVIPENIPQELKDWPQWVVWRYEWKEAEQKWDKPPRRPRLGALASPTDRQTWDTYELGAHRLPGLVPGLGRHRLLHLR